MHIQTFDCQLFDRMCLDVWAYFMMLLFLFFFFFFRMHFDSRQANELSEWKRKIKRTKLKCVYELHIPLNRNHIHLDDYCSRWSDSITRYINELIVVIVRRFNSLNSMKLLISELIRFGCRYRIDPIHLLNQRMWWIEIYWQTEY